MKEKFLVTGGSRLEGSVRISGAKNSALKLMAASLLSESPSIIHNIPDIADVQTMIELLKHIGVGAEYSEGTLEIVPPAEAKLEAPYYLVQRMRASIGVLGPLLARYGKARVAMPGGCNIGTRQIDMHLEGLEHMGASLSVSHGYIEAQAPKLSGAHINLDFASVGATENLLMAGILAEGETVIENAAKEPEISDLADFLISMGADISGAGTSTLVTNGVKSLHGTEHNVVGDRIEAGTFLMAGAVTGGDVKVTGVNPEHLEIVLEKTREAGCKVEAGVDEISISANGRARGVEISTLPYPGFPTDLQPQILTLLSIGEGVSFITENIFDNRFMVVDELNRLGANIKTRDHHAIVRGVDHLSGAPVSSTDLRAGAALVIAGLVAEGTTEVYEIQHIDRGYENFAAKLSSLGANIERLPAEA